MAIVQNPLIARTSGSVGNSVFSKWKRKNTLRSKSINPYPAPSPSQVVNRNVFSAAISYVNQIKPFMPYFYRGKKLSKSVYNVILSNIISCIDSSTLKLNPQKISRIILSSGIYPLTSDWQLQDSFDQFNCWATNPPFPFNVDFEGFSVLIAYSEDLDMFKPVSRQLALGPLNYGGLSHPSSGTVRTHIWSILCSPDDKLSSPSFYVGFANIDINLLP